MTQKRIALVAGATGLVGRALCDILASDSHYGAVHVLVRRPNAGLSEGSIVHAVDFGKLADPGLPDIDDAYCCLGTTRADAGSDAAFRRVDYDYVLAFARLARARGATRLGLVSALGADPGSRVLYTRTKGEAERDLQALGFDTLAIARPSFLAGSRHELGQKARPLEALVLGALAPVTWLVPRSLRPVAAVAVARGLVATLVQPPAGCVILTSDALQEYAKGSP